MADGTGIVPVHSPVHSCLTDQRRICGTTTMCLTAGATKPRFYRRLSHGTFLQCSNCLAALPICCVVAFYFRIASPLKAQGSEHALNRMEPADVGNGLFVVRRGQRVVGDVGWC